MAVDLSQFRPVSDEELGQFAPDLTDAGFTPVDEAQLSQFKPESSAGLRERLRFNLQNDYQPDQGNLWDQAMLGIGEGVSSLPGQAGGVASFFGSALGNYDAGRSLQDYSRRKQAEYENLGDTLGVSPSAQLTRNLASQVAQQVPSLALGLAGGLPVIAAGAGLQSLGQIQSEATQAYEAQGLSREEAVQRASGPAAFGGVVTAALTRFIPGGADHLIDQIRKGTLNEVGVKALLRRLPAEALKEYPEEALDQLSQGFVAKATYDPEKPWGEVFQEAHDAGALGSLISVGVGGLPVAAEGLAALRGREARPTAPAPAQPTLPEGARVVNAPGGQTRVVDASGNILQVIDNPMMGLRDVAPIEESPANLRPPAFQQAAPAPEEEQQWLMTLPPLPSEDVAAGEQLLQNVLGEIPRRVTASDVVQAAQTPPTNQPISPTEGATSPSIQTDAVPAPAIEAPLAAQPSDTETPFEATNRERGALEQTNRAEGIKNIRSLIDRSALTEDTKFVARKVLGVIEKTGLDHSSLSLELTQSLPNGRAGSIIDSAIRAINTADPTIIPHEVSHILYTLLPQEHRSVISEARLANMPSDAPEGVRSGTMTTQQFVDENLSPELYPFLNDQEYLAHFFGYKFATDQLGKRDATLGKRIQIWLKEIWDAIKSKFKDPATMDRVYADLVNGRYQVTPESGLKSEQERGGFATTARQAQAEGDLARNPADEKFAGEDFIAQAETPVAVLQKTGVFTLPFKERQKFFTDDLVKILEQGVRLNGAPEPAAQIAARSSPAMNEFRAGAAAQHVRRIESRLAELIADGQNAKTELASVRVQKLVRKMNAHYVAAQLAGNIKADTQATIQTSINQALADLKQERATDLEIGQIESELKALKDVQQSTVAMERLLDDMTATLMASPQGQSSLQGATARDIAAIYRDVKTSTKQPIQSTPLIRVASFLLSRNVELKDALLTNLYAKSQQAQNVANAAMRGLFDRLKKDPETTIERLMQERERRASTATEAEFLFFQMQKEFSKEIEGYYERMKSGRIAESIRVDPDWVKYRNATFDAAGHSAEAPVDPFKEGLVVMQSPITKKDVAIGANRISDSTAETTKAVREWAHAITEWKQWLDDPANTADMAVYRTREQQLEVLEDYYNSSFIASGQKSPAWVNGFSQLKYVIEYSGSRITPAARSVLGKLDILDDKVAAWLRPTMTEISVAQRKARESHDLSEMDTAQAIERYNETVLQELASLNQRAGGPGVGDTLMSGETVTREDIDYISAISHASKRLFEVVRKHDQVVLEDTRGLKQGEKSFRKELATSEFTMPRAPKLELSSDANIKAVATSFALYSQSENPQTLSALNDAISQIWPEHGKYLLNERNPDFAKPTVFDGKGGAFALLADRIRQNQNAFQTFDDFISALAQYTQATPEQTRQIVLNEFGRIVSGFYHAVAPEEAAGGRLIGGDPTNFFTTARSNQLAPSSFYRTGWATDTDIRGAAGAAVSVGVKRLVDVLKQIQAEQKTQERALSTASRALGGKKSGKKKAITAQRIAQRNGQAYSDWVALDKRQRMVSNAIKDLENAKIIGSDSGWARLGGAVISSLIGNSITTLRNTAPIYPYRALRNAGASPLRAFIGSFGFGTAQTARLLGQLSYGITRAGVFGLKGLIEGTAAGIKDKSLREFWRHLMRGVIHELGNATPERLHGFRAMQADGAYHITDAQAEFDNRMADMLYKGGLPSIEAGTAGKIGMGVAATFENTIGAVVNSIFPLAGDAAVNTSLWNFEHSRSGTNAVFGQKIRSLYADWKKTNLRTFDLANPNAPENIVSQDELGISRRELSNYRQTFSAIGRSFDAAVADYMARLEKDPNAQFLTDQEISKLVEYHVNNANRKSYGNANRWMSSHPIIQHWLAPLLHWSARQFSEWASMVSVPTEGHAPVKDATELQIRDLALWGLTMTGVIVAMATAGATSAQRDDWIGRMIRYALFKGVSQNKQPWEYGDETGQLAQRAAGLGMESVPFLSWLATYFLPQNTPARASFDPGLVMFNKAIEAINGVRKLAATRDVRGPAMDLARGFLPQDVRIVTSRMESESGKLERSNFLNLMKRFGPTDLKRPRESFRAANPNLTELSPYGPRMYNDAFNGQDEQLRQTFREAIDVAKKLGRKDPEKTVAQIFHNANPTLIAFTQMPTKAQYDEMVKSMGTVGPFGTGEGPRVQFLAAKAKLEHAAGVLGLPQPKFWKDEPSRGSLRDSRMGMREARAR